MCSSKGLMPGHLPSYKRSPYCPSVSRHDCQLPSSIERLRSDSDVNCARPMVARPTQHATVTAVMHCHFILRHAIVATSAMASCGCKKVAARTLELRGRTAVPL